MAASILLRTIGGIDDKRVVLSSAQGARLLAIGSTWTDLRVGLRWAVNGTAAISGSPRFFVGLCSGTANKYGNLTTTHAVGIRPSAATWTYASVAPTYYSMGAIYAVRKVGSTESTLHTSLLSTAPYICANPATNMNPWMIQFKKNGGTNWGIRANGPSNSTAHLTHRTQAELVGAMEGSDFGSAATALGVYGGIERSVTVDEAAGLLDAVCVHWDRSSVTVEIAEIVVAVFA
jgi:hypothetical protein